jgi:DNA/RNA-binding domain of Phe-tRNA-synthetase-like protein
VQLAIDDHPLLEAGTFVTTFPRPLAEVSSPAWLVALLHAEAEAPLRTDEDVRRAVRDLLRHGGFKPTGRSKPASEYLARAAGDGTLGPINAAVDTCNVVSLHSGLPVSVIDVDLARAPFRIGLAAAGAEYVFNPAGQVIRIDGLLSLHDAAGPCAGPVKDSQRTKTHAGTLRTLTVVWGTRALGGRTARAVAWYGELLVRLGAAVEPAASGAP